MTRELHTFCHAVRSRIAAAFLSCRTAWWHWRGRRLAARDARQAARRRKQDERHRRLRERDLIGSSISITTRSTGRRSYR